MMVLGVLWLWGTAVSLDLISIGQFMIARPIVAGTVAGLIVGDPVAGGVVGMVLELFALDILPTGSIRYPDYGIGAVAGTVVAADAPRMLGLGLAVTVGLVVAYLGEIGIAHVRSMNSKDVRRVSEQLDAGDWAAIAATHMRGLSRDVVRAGSVALVGLGAAAFVATRPLVTVRGAIMVTVVIIGAAIGTAAVGAMRLGGRGLGLKWFVLGLLLVVPKNPAYSFLIPAFWKSAPVFWKPALRHSALCHYRLRRIRRL